METKICTKCEKEFPLTGFRKARTKSGYLGYCKECSRIKDKEQYRNMTPEQKTTRFQTYKRYFKKKYIPHPRIDENRTTIVCKHCKEEKSLDCFEKKEGLHARRNICKICRPKTREKQMRVYRKVYMLTDGYAKKVIRANIRKSTGLVLSNEEIPEIMIDLTKRRISLNKKIKNHGNEKDKNQDSY